MSWKYNESVFQLSDFLVQIFVLLACQEYFVFHRFRIRQLLLWNFGLSIENLALCSKFRKLETGVSWLGWAMSREYLVPVVGTKSRSLLCTLILRAHSTESFDSKFIDTYPSWTADNDIRMFVFVSDSSRKNRNARMSHQNPARPVERSRDIDGMKVFWSYPDTICVCFRWYLSITHLIRMPALAIFK